MSKNVEVTGLNALVKGLKKRSKRYEKGFERGIVKAALFLQRESQLIVPVDTGTLRNSAFTRKVGKGLNTDAVVGYTAFYAVYVHENTTAQHAAGKSAKYLEKPYREKRPEIRQIINDEVAKEAGK